jgi:hypothetical protein
MTGLADFERQQSLPPSPPPISSQEFEKLEEAMEEIAREKEVGNEPDLPF